VRVSRRSADAHATGAAPLVAITVDAVPEVTPYVAADAGPTVVDARVDALAPEDIRAFIESRAGYLIEACGARAGAVREYRVTVTVDADGRPSKFLNKEFGELAVCVQNKIGVWRLPRSPRGGEAEVTITFPVREP
jgi:hypothetical protein